jgi:hypothetical protein
MRANKLRSEAAFTCCSLREAAVKLLMWAELQQGDPCPLIPNEHLRELAHALAKQGGRLDMAAEMSAPTKKRS